MWTLILFLVAVYLIVFHLIPYILVRMERDNGMVGDLTNIFRVIFRFLGKILPFALGLLILSTALGC